MPVPKIAINGFGRIGRSLARLLACDPDIEVVAINDIADNEPLAYLRKHDAAEAHSIEVTAP